jgi:hypothetical protein
VAKRTTHPAARIIVNVALRMFRSCNPQKEPGVAGRGYPACDV